MELEHKKIGFVLTGSFCTFSKTIPKIKELVKMGSEVIPIMSYNAYNLDTKFGKAEDFINEIEEITGKKIIHTIQEPNYWSKALNRYYGSSPLFW